MRFLSLDVETANPDLSTICQVGVGIFENGVLTGTWSSYVDPKDYFHWRFIEIHGITAAMVRDQPSFPAIYPELRELFENNIVVHHSPFDRTAFRKVYERYGLEDFPMRWLDSVQVARKAWKNVYGGYGLANLAQMLDIDFRHHDALEDSVACGKIVAAACRLHKCTAHDWL